MGEPQYSISAGLCVPSASSALNRPTAEDAEGYAETRREEIDIATSFSNCNLVDILYFRCALFSRLTVFTTSLFNHLTT